MPRVPITTHYLEMLRPEQLRPHRTTPERGAIRRAADDFRINRDYYKRVGANWTWTDRLGWNDQRWREYLARGIETWIGHLGEEPVGYFELDPQPDSGVEIAYFGLLPEFIGQGLGGWLLTEAVRHAWSLNPKRVWVHTCTLDHPQAVANYVARGMTLYQSEPGWQEVP